MSTMSGLTFPFYNRRAEKARLLSFAELALASIIYKVMTIDIKLKYIIKNKLNLCNIIEGI